MKTVRSLTLLALTATTLVSSAAVMNITVDSAGNYLQNGADDPLDPTDVFNPDNSLASRDFYNNETGVTNNNWESNLALLEKVLGYWNATRDPDLPSATTLALNVENISGVNPDDNINDVNSYTALAGYDYVVFHFGSGEAGGGSNDAEKGWWSVWYLGGDSKVFNAVPQEGNPLQNVGGFSSARYFNGRTPPTDRVPDGGAAITSLGIALLGLGGLRRLIKKA